jgi:hypothetical protein
MKRPDHDSLVPTRAHRVRPQDAMGLGVVERSQPAPLARLDPQHIRLI